MDTSEQYIKMCEKAEEIQKLWKWGGVYDGYNRWKQGVIFAGDDVIYQEGEVRDDPPYIEGRKCIWLPRQDQLQEMEEVGFVWEQLNGFNLWFDDEVYIRGILQFDKFSWEQLWLAFVMKEKYNKVWDGKEWIIKKGGV